MMVLVLVHPQRENDPGTKRKKVDEEKEGFES